MKQDKTNFSRLVAAVIVTSGRATDQALDASLPEINENDIEVYAVELEKIIKLIRESVQRPEPVVVLGYEFRPMTRHDWMGYAGAAEGTLIHHAKHADLLWDPKTETLSEMLWKESDASSYQRDWTFIEVG